MKNGVKNLSGVVICVASLAPLTSHASLWQIEQVLSGSDGGYGYSSFHDSSGSNPMSGGNLGTILSTASGTYDDVSGLFQGSFTVDPAASGEANTGFTAVGTLPFAAGDAFLDTGAVLTLDFDGTLSRLFDTAVGFMSGDICCNGNANATPGLDPNSFDPTTGILTLWGSDGYFMNNNLQIEYGANAEIGMDLRVQLSQVPLPGSLPLLGVGILGLALARRKNYLQHSK